MPREDGETNVDELRRVKVPVVVPRDGDGDGERHAGSVDRLEDALEVAPPSNLLDEDRCEPLRSELLVDAEEVDLDRAEVAVWRRLSGRA